MSTGLIIAIIVVAVIVIALLVFALPRMRARALERRRQRQLEQRREEVVSENRGLAQERHQRAEVAERRARIAEQEAVRERAEARMHEERAALHEQGLADHELTDQPDTGDGAMGGEGELAGGRYGAGDAGMADGPGATPAADGEQFPARERIIDRSSDQSTAETYQEGRTRS